MADYYTQFSFEIALTTEQKAQAKNHFDLINLDPNGDEHLNFNYEEKPKGWWIHSKEWDDPDIETLADFLHDLVVLCDLDPIGFEWANTCSKPCLESFGGGAVWITKDGFEWFSTNTWLYEKCSSASTQPKPENSESLRPLTEPEAQTSTALAQPPADCFPINIEELYNSILIT